jgi:hypothetical protein
MRNKKTGYLQDLKIIITFAIPEILVGITKKREDEGRKMTNKKIGCPQDLKIINAFAIPAILSGFASSELIDKRNDELIASLCYMSEKSPREVKDICEKLPYQLDDIREYYWKVGKFPE